jgi:hypothetical protein
MAHPTKRGVTAVSSYPLLPDVKTWGYTFTHVVLDHAPKPQVNIPAPNEDQLCHAYVADVQEVSIGRSQKMVCNLLVPVPVEDDKNKDKESDDDDDEDSAFAPKKAKKYDVVQQYDLDVIALKKEAEETHNTYFLVIDDHSKKVTYHPLSSRVSLSTGRPGRRAPTYFTRRSLDAEDHLQIEEQAAEVK